MKKNRVELNSELFLARLTIPAVADIVDYYSLNVPMAVNITNVTSKVQESIDLLEESEIVSHIASDYMLFGEAFVLAVLDERKSQWNEFKLINPSSITVKHDVVTGKRMFSLLLNDDLRKAAAERPKELPDIVIKCVDEDRPIPLDDFYFTPFMNMAYQYHVRGSSPFLPFIDNLEEKSDEARKMLGCSEFPNLARQYNIASMISRWLRTKVISPIVKMNDLKEADIPYVS